MMYIWANSSDIIITMIEYILIGIIVLQFGYTIFKDILYKDQMEKLQLKFMSQDVHEYKAAIEKDTPRPKPAQPDPYIDIEDVSLAELVKAKDNI
jgi:hypothetical protein